MPVRSNNTPILVSVITVVRNAESTIGATLQSVCALKSDQVEYIVVDGKSTDQTLSIINTFSECVDVLISEEDDGIYDAMNKAILVARGQFLLHINAGDLLLCIPAPTLVQAQSNIAIISFSVKLSSGEIFQPSAGPLLSLTNTLHHQGNFYRSSLMRPYDLRYKTFADFDLNQRLAGNVSAIREGLPVALHSTDGQSHDRRHFHEVYTIVRRNHGTLRVALAWAFFKARGIRHRFKWLFRFS